MFIPIILAGGSGSRLWPLSRSSYPKQFLTLFGDYTLFQETIIRAQRLKPDFNPVIVCHEDYRFIVAEQLRQIAVRPACIILEAEGKNTAPAFALAAYFAQQQAWQAPLLLMPADHVLDDQASFSHCHSTSMQIGK